jgi:hypothetical protein
MAFRRTASILFPLVLVAACGGRLAADRDDGSHTAPAPPGSATGPSRPPPPPPPGSFPTEPPTNPPLTLKLPSGTIAVCTATAGVTYYSPDAVSGAKPLGHLDWNVAHSIPQYLTFDASGALYLDSYAFDADGDPARIDIFAPGAAGGSAPVRTIAGPHTALDSARAMVVDARGFLYVANGVVSGGPSAILVFAPDASGDVAPVRTISLDTREVGWWLPSGMAMNAKRELVIGDSSGSSLELLPSDANGATSALASYGRSVFGDVTGVAIDARGRMYVADWSKDAVFTFAADGSLIGQIGGTSTGIDAPTDVAIDHAGRVLVANGTGGVHIFAAETIGNVAPIAAISTQGGYNVAVRP